MSAPTSQAIKQLYSTTLQASKSFTSYNFRNYFVDRTHDSFRSMQEEKDPSKLESRYKEALNELKVLQRSAIVNQLYGGRQLAVEDAPAKEPEATLERADN